MRYLLPFLRGCLFLGVAWLPTLSLAQVTVDSTRSSYTEEHVSYSEELLTTPLKPARKLALPDTTRLRVQREDRNLWKLGLNNIWRNEAFGPVYPIRYSGYTRFGFHLAYERKLHRPAWSVLGEVSPAMLRVRVYQDYQNFSYQWAFSVRTQLAGRYYYNLERRIRQGRGAGNFSANYFSFVLGAGIGRYSDTPFFREVQYNRWVQSDGALLYGLQRRLGKHGFVDANVGVVSLFTSYNHRLQPGGSLRVGLALGAAYTPPAPLPEEEIPLPRLYVGVQAGVYGYRIPNQQYYSNLGVGIGPYVYVGRYLRPRLAVQVGLQYQYNETSYGQFPGPDANSRVENKEYTFAAPVLLRYSLTKAFAQRVQFEVVGGAALLMGIVRYQSSLYRNGQVVSQSSGREQGWAVNPTAGLDISYGFGRKRQMQATLEGVLIKSLTDSYYTNFGRLLPGISAGLRYRLAYQ